MRPFSVFMAVFAGMTTVCANLAPHGNEIPPFLTILGIFGSAMFAAFAATPKR